MIFILPGDVDDLTVPSGGNLYDRRVSRGLAAAGLPVHEVAVPGAWPQPDANACARLAEILVAAPDGETVLVDGLVACGVPEVMVPEARRVRLVVLVHLPLADETGLEPDVAADLDARERETLHAAAAVVATSPWAANRLAGQHGLPGDRIHVVTPGSDPAPLAPGTDGASRLLCVASVTPRKGQDLLVQALATLAGLPWSCECVGPVRRDPHYVQRLRELIARHGIEGRITLTGPRTGRPLEDSYAAADLVVLPSRAETYGMVVTEALARGIPVLATAVQALPDTLGQAPNGSLPGILVPPDDPVALADGLHRWLSDRELRSRVRTAARFRRGMLAAWDETARRMANILVRTTS